ncbi:nuclear transport factor 2 family protein [Bradyrhizobium yuanmingense]|uniref:nuclear transport factor 2 family protein n=1 Tax=Bradyrhizobium yuanmingense TaxID=108015 RepID=UPI0023B96429|nr:nuclear transport factor 2 family protein [Bradyrhizobium yuanmingense]MDF0498880.1 nuclear transport factor 2 family protein [Bradyrhizobium yuanmingense]
MVEHCFWRFSRALRRAVNDRYVNEIESLIAEEVSWALYGPIDMFPFPGARQGRQAVLDVIGRLSENVQIRNFERERTILGIDSDASMLRCCLMARTSDTPIALRVAQFAHFEAGRLVDMRVLIDTLDLVEQSLGRTIDLPMICRPRHDYGCGGPAKNQRESVGSGV